MNISIALVPTARNGMMWEALDLDNPSVGERFDTEAEAIAYKSRLENGEDNE